jgi:ligand-binding sensor domain-containing protein
MQRPYQVTAVVLIIVLTLSTPPIYAFHRISVTTTLTPFSQIDGLASDSILSLHQAVDGHTWIGTNDGLTIRSPFGDWLTLDSADGLAGDIVTDITPDPSNVRRIWFASFGGVTLLDDGGAPINTIAHSRVTFTKSDGLVKEFASTVAVDNANQVWIGTGNIDDNGNELGYGLSVVNINGTLFDKSDDVWTTYTAVAGGLSNNVIRDIAVDAQGTVWIATKSGLNAFAANAWSVYYTSDGLPSNDITALMIDNNVIWVGTKNGIAAFNSNSTPHTKTDDQWATYTPVNSGLTDGRTKSISRDESGRLWIGTNYISTSTESDEGLGVFVFDPAGTPFNQVDDMWTSFNTDNGLAENAVRAVVASGNLAWIGTKSGLSRISFGASPFIKFDDAVQNFFSSNRLAGASVNAIAHTSGDSIWLGTESGLSLLQYNATPHNKRDDTYVTFTTANSRLPSDSIRALASDSKGRLWIGTAAGLLVIDTRGTPSNPIDDLSILYDTTNGLVSNQINDIVIDAQGRGWISAGSYFNGALHVLDIGASIVSNFDDLWGTFTQSNSGLPDPYVRATAIDGVIVWIATQNGAARLSTNGTPFNRADDTWSVFTTSNSGIGNNTVRDVKIDNTKTIWFALALEGASALTSGGSWVGFKQSDGLVTNSVDALYVDLDGSIWFGTEGGGVSILNLNGTPTSKGDDAWTTHAAGSDLRSGNIVAFNRDRWGQIWIGTFGGGASVQSFVQFRRVVLPIVRK